MVEQLLHFIEFGFQILEVHLHLLLDLDVGTDGVLGFLRLVFQGLVHVDADELRLYQFDQVVDQLVVEIDLLVDCDLDLPVAGVDPLAQHFLIDAVEGGHVEGGGEDLLEGVEDLSEGRGTRSWVRARMRVAWGLSGVCST